MNKLGLFLAVLLFGINQNDSNGKEKKPLHFAMNEEWKLVVQEELIFTHSISDTLPELEILLHSDSLKQPLFFTSEIKTPVCIDGICKPVELQVYWNLLGNYVGFGLINEIPLTKYDHEEFEPTDYEKFHQLLLNEKSVLREKKLEDFYDKNIQSKEVIKYKGEAVDGMTGATKKEIKESIVEGALYSCYTIWHLVHGEVSKRMKEFFSANFSDEFKGQFLNSDYADYQFFALKKCDENDFENHINRILEILQNASPLIRTYVLKKLPISIWQDEIICHKLYQSFTNLDIQSKTLLIKKLPQSHPKSSVWLSHHIDKMTKNQLKTYLNFLAENQSNFPSEISNNLKQMTLHPTYAFGYLIADFLSEHDE